HELDRPF
ncbi:hypothetical protein D049_0014B, partial [Vibrio parahaemolyticus VPTS-2010]